MKKEILDYYKKISMYTNYGEYKEYFKSLPDDLKELTKLINDQYIHRVTLFKSYFRNDKIKEEYPWYDYRLHDDILLTVPAITAELFRLDNRGFTHQREIKDKVIITCRYASILLASILKAKGYSARVRSGFGKYFYEDKYIDHWIVEYYNETKEKWIIVDSDELESSLFKKYNNIDVNRSYYYTAGEAWLKARSGKENIDKFVHGGHITGLDMLARSLFYDFHSLMNDEISYLFFPTYLDESKEFFNLTVDELKELDDLATLMINPDENFDELRYLYENDKKFRTINTPLLSDRDHLELQD
jgi:hypothetical protein